MLLAPASTSASVQRVSKQSAAKGDDHAGSPKRHSAPNGPSRRGFVECYFCHELGHMLMACPKLTKLVAQGAAVELKKQSKKVPQSSVVDEDTSASEDEVSDDSTEVDVRRIGRRRIGRISSVSPILGIPASRFG